ncbi:energy transducer TonB [Ferrimonas futtsuensis]|uniref:energy transducer TonB n=1 Tax=Ferrimonas futtsuensis TaxID=364764 RepID=UPI00146D32DA|nr:energy transducer TonB [Ferrimonas futtsuensis]
MKFLLFALAAMMSFGAGAANTQIFLDVQVSDLAPEQGAKWMRDPQEEVLFPIELARLKGRGCAVLSFDISAEGKAENIEIVESIPKRELGIHGRKMVRRWEWLPVSEAEPMVENKRLVRLDFCMGEESAEQVEQYCKQQTKLDCRL